MDPKSFHLRQSLEDTQGLLFITNSSVNRLSTQEMMHTQN